MSDPWQRVLAVFEQIVARPVDQRAARLSEACGDDHALRREVESLLRHHDSAGEDFLRPAPHPPSHNPTAGASPQQRAADDERLVGTEVGRYSVYRILATGGMGTVYLARQRQPHRDVALKLVHAGAVSSSTLRRLEYEAEVLAHLAHPNIAQVFEAGTHEGRPFFAMEYIPDAQPITDYAAERGLTARQRLDLFTQVCEAVQYGHQRGVIHRDLKPANILVDAAGRVKVIDFGIARATDADVTLPTLYTEIGQLVGTLQYMSPEQCAADPHALDVRSDVYSLGVVLYELLCGQLPYDVRGASLASGARIICEQPPPRPSSITGRKKGTGSAPSAPRRAGSRPPAVPVPFFRPPVRGDLERIILKALEKDPRQRYQSAADLLRDIRHYQNREPIEAKPPTVWTRAVRWVARHPALSTTVGCLLIAASVLAATFWTVHVFNARPHRMRTSPDRREVRLLTRIGGVLQSWTTKGDYNIVVAELADRPPKFGGGHLVLLSYGDPRDPAVQRLCAYDPDLSLDKPLWTRGVQTSDVLPELRKHRGATGADFRAHHVWLVNVFPDDDHPGEEIVVTFAFRDLSARVLRIYDLSGMLLYQVWHDGTINDLVTLADSQLLIFSGDYHQPYWTPDGELIGTPDDPLKTKDHVVFALRPVPGKIARDDWIPCVDRTDDNPLHPVWYRRLVPDQFSESVGDLSLDALHAATAGADLVKVSIRFGQEFDPPACYLFIESSGRTVPNSHGAVDRYKQKRANRDSELPDWNGWRFEPMPTKLVEQAERRRAVDD